MSTDNAMDPLAFTEKIADGTTGVGLVWAQTTAGVIGKDGDMPWHLPEDMKHFTRLTTGHPVIMGRKTWLSFPDKYRPLPGRTNIVVTRQEGWGDTPEAQGALAVKSLDDALLESQFAPGHETVWVLGGGEIFAQTLDIANVAVVTFIDSETDGDTYAPDLGFEWKLAASEPATGWLTSTSGTRYRFTMWRRTEG
ncbi:dihydrofolate reductase [Arthrobacter oryzae]|jgi:dihydrofolate reductase|uniref:dihydrofolate reductase n=1 Tax=Arthrobacter oryzae TaxID=409290 RepID=UPI00285B191B|nr:dihydrofolate reductase [Arthrobacter oryzae]MDR6505270.1 dihydrofolate reductase [Arthrobacter oryzae]